MKKFIFLLLLFVTACSEKNHIEIKRNNVETKEKHVFTEQEITLGEAQTNIIDSGKNRVSNIKTACSAISGKKLYPGEEFSFNNATGKRNYANGYKDAPIISDGEKSYGVGGGVCQVSTTIYMAAQNANLKISEHHNHSTTVAYASSGNDATVVFGIKDMKFINNTKNTIYIYVWTDSATVHSKIIVKTIV